MLPATFWTARPPVWACLAIAVVIGLAAALPPFIWARHHRRELDRLCDELVRPTEDASAFSPTVAPILRAVKRNNRLHRRQLHQLARRRKSALIELRVAQNQLQHAQAILRVMNDAVIVTDAFNELIAANEAAQRMLRFDLEHCRRQPIERAVQEPSLLKLIRDARESSPGLSRRQEQMIREPGGVRFYDITVAPVTDERQEVAGVVMIMRDITREKQIAEMKSDFVSGVSHELRTPLSSIRAYIEMLVDGEAGDEHSRREFYNIIQSETNRLSRLIDNILNISRIESGIVRMQREEVAVTAVLRDALEVMQPQARARHVSLTTNFNAGDARVSGDRDMLLQVVLNLVSNAVKYTPSGGRIVIDTSIDQARRAVVISVSDTGVGVPPEDLPHIWDKFYRVADHKKIAKGTGLGLNLVKHVVETVHQGHVSVKSEVGVGSTFSLSLPLLDTAAMAAGSARLKGVLA
jgi:two-component system phosphate regulon sensor histidine kinase PhoR